MKLYKLFNKKVFHIEPGLERIREACAFLGYPEKNFPSILISGTNGKGSTAAYLESLFRNHGFKTGLFTSPHLVEENERWQINRKKIPSEKISLYIEQLKSIIEKYKLTYFEASTLLAFKFFSDEKVDIAILEVGLGGRWDSTNVVEPELSIITNVSLDHTHLLGNSVEKISEEKLGISRKNKPLIIGTEQIEIISKAIMKGIREIYHYPIGFSYKKRDFNHFDFFYRGKKISDLEISMLGERQIHNASLALASFLVYAEKKGIPVIEDSIRKSLKETVWPGRMQILEKEPTVILDGAHNEDAVIKTIQEVERIFPDKDIIFLYSGMRDKDWKKILSILKYRGDVISTEIPVSRSLGREEFISEGVDFEENVKIAIEKAKIKALKENKVLLILGSLYLAGEVLKIYENEES